VTARGLSTTRWRRTWRDAFPSMRDLPAMCACYALVALLAVMVMRPDLVMRVALAVLP